MMSCFSRRICTGRKGLSRKDVTKLVRLQIVYKAFYYFSYLFDCFALLVYWPPKFASEESDYREGSLSLLCLHYASSSLSWLYIKALNIFHSNLIVLIGIWKEDVEQGELGAVNFFHQYWIESGKFWLICLIHSSVVSVSSEQCKHVNWLTTRDIKTTNNSILF